MHRLGRIVCLALLVGCARRQPAELARTTPWATARDHGRYVTVNGLGIFAITLGGGRDVLLLHGNPASTYSWRKVMGPLAARYRIHVIDLPGFGFSDKPDDASYPLAAVCARACGRRSTIRPSSPTPTSTPITRRCAAVVGRMPSSRASTRRRRRSGRRACGRSAPRLW